MSKNKTPKKSIKHHIKHKSRLILFLIIKVFLIFVISIFILGGVYSLLNKSLNIVFVFIISFAIASFVYLFLIIKILKLFKF